MSRRTAHPALSGRRPTSRSSGRSKACCARFSPPLISNVGPQRSESWHAGKAGSSMHVGLSVLRRPADGRMLSSAAAVFPHRDPRKPSPSHGLSVLRRPARRQPEWLRRDMEALRTVSHGELEAISAQASGMNPTPRRRPGSSGFVAATICRMLPSSLPVAPWPNPSIERTCLKPLRAFSPAAHVER